MLNKLTFAIPVTWSQQTAYEGNMIVFIGKKAYTALQDVPAGTPITDTSYWSETGVPYVDLTEVRNAISGLDTRVTSNATAISGIDTRVTTNSGNISTLTANLATAVAQLSAATETIENIMISLYTPQAQS